MVFWRYLNERNGAVTLSLVSNSLLILLKVAVGLYTGSVSILSEAIHSSTDLLAAVIAFFAIRQASRPADLNHQYGHGKAESLSAAVEALLIFLAAVLIVYEAAQRLLHGATVENVEWGIGVMLFASVVNLAVSRHLFSVARRTESPALAADAWHLATDLYTALGVGLGLVLVRVTGLRAFDPLVAMGVALFIVRAAWNITRGSVGDLLDERLPPADEARIHGILDAHQASFFRVRAMRTRRSGSHRHVYLAIEFPPGVSLARAHRTTAHLEEDIRKAFPDISAVVEAEPAPQQAEAPSTIIETIERIARTRQLAIYELALSRPGERWDVDLELQTETELGPEQVREQAAEMQADLRHEHPDLGQIKIAVEPSIRVPPRASDKQPTESRAAP